MASQTSVILVDEVSGERTVLWTRPDGLALRAEELDRAVLGAGRALLLDADDADTAILAAGWAKEAGALVMLDVDEPGPRTDELLALSDAVIVSDGFPQRHTGVADLRTALRRMAARGPQLVAATLGAGGALACADGRLLYVPAFRVSVVDSTSAGDLFHAGCLYGLLQAWPVAAHPALRQRRRRARLRRPGRARQHPGTWSRRSQRARDPLNPLECGGLPPLRGAAGQGEARARAEPA